MDMAGTGTREYLLSDPGIPLVHPDCRWDKAPLKLTQNIRSDKNGVSNHLIVVWQAKYYDSREVSPSRMANLIKSTMLEKPSFSIS